MRLTSLRIAATVAATLAVLLMLFAVYEKNSQIREYKRISFGAREDYKKLSTEYNDLKNKIKNLRKVNVTTSGSRSKNNTVAHIIEAHAKNIDGDLSIYYNNLTTGESVVVDSDKTYYMASLYKVILTLYILEQIKDEKTTLSNTIGDPPITIEEALNKIITESNNEYAVALAETYGWANIESVMKPKLGIDFTFDESLKTSVINIGKLFEEIALSLGVTDTQSEYLLKLLADQTKTSKLPKYLPKNIISHNKTGEYASYSHDAAIFYTPKTNYILIFMSNTASPGGVDEQMAQMSKEIYEVLNK